MVVAKYVMQPSFQTDKASLVPTKAAFCVRCALIITYHLTTTGRSIERPF
jgi:hypothetical protein